MQGCRPSGPVPHFQCTTCQRTIYPFDGGTRAIVAFHRPNALVEDLRRVAVRCRRDQAGFRPGLGFVILPDRHNVVRRYAVEPRREVACSIRFFGVDNGRRGGDTPGVVGIDVAERSQAPDQAGRLGPHGTREGVGLVEYQVVEARTREQFDVLLSGEEQLQLLDVGEEDAGLLAGRPHGLAGADFFGRVDRLAKTALTSFFQTCKVVRPRRWAVTTPGHIILPLRRFPDVDAKRHSSTGQEPPNPHQLVLGQGVHRVDDDGADPRGRRLVLEAEALADHRVEEALGLPRARPGGNQSRAAIGDRPDRAFLVAVQVSDLRRDPFREVGVDEAVIDHLLDGSTGPEGAGKADVRTAEEGGGAGMVERKKIAHLREEVGVGEGVCGELVAEKALRDLLDVGDGVQGHGG